FPTPGSEDVFGFLADSFTLRDGAPHPDGAKAWVVAISSEDRQTEFSKAKGSIPARTDADPHDFPESQQDAMESYVEYTKVYSLAHGAATPAATLSNIEDAVSKYTTGAADLDELQQTVGDAVAGE